VDEEKIEVEQQVKQPVEPSIGISKKELAEQMKPVYDKYYEEMREKFPRVNIQKSLR
jgi:hypothetical protein